jgi:hypothetical protein
LFADLSVQAIMSTLCYWYLFWGTSLRQVAGAVASSLTNPLDVVKTRVMTQTRGGNVVHGGLRSIAKQIWMEEVKTHSFQTLCVANCVCNSFCSPCAFCTLCLITAFSSRYILCSLTWKTFAFRHACRDWRGLVEVF